MNDLISRDKAIAETWRETGYSDPANVLTEIRDRLRALPSEESKIVRCKDCRNRGEAKCPMRHVEIIEWEEDGYIESDDIVHDYTEPHGYCYKGERNE
jgi:hypothetical protein